MYTNTHQKTGSKLPERTLRLSGYIRIILFLDILTKTLSGQQFTLVKWVQWVLTNAQFDWVGISGPLQAKRQVQSILFLSKWLAVWQMTSKFIPELVSLVTLIFRRRIKSCNSFTQTLPSACVWERDPCMWVREHKESMRMGWHLQYNTKLQALWRREAQSKTDTCMIFLGNVQCIWMQMRVTISWTKSDLRI